MNNLTQHWRRIFGMYRPVTGAALAFAIMLVPAVLATRSAQAQTFTTLHSFVGPDGESPYAGLVQATNGNLYGTTYHGGANGDGTVFKMTTRGTLPTLHSFDYTDGASLWAGLAQATNGNLYGTTYLGGAYGYGTVFKITPSGTLTTLHSFEGTDGSSPLAGLVQATDGNLYGTTQVGGTSNAGTVFKITPSGTLTTLHSFEGADGAHPYAGLVQASNGNLYGTTYEGGAYGYGTIFKITPSGTLTTLHSFEGTDGAYPFAGLIQATNGNLYGTTSYAGANGYGTVFKISPSSTLTTTLHSFEGTDGAYPYAGLVQATDGNFYGTTFQGGGNGSDGGTIFKITPSGMLTTLYSFCSQSGCTDGAYPYYARLVQDTNGTFYGTTDSGGANGLGTVFSLSVGLGPFVETQTTSGKVGAAVEILGTNLTGATSVTFNGTAAVFKVVASSEITTTVPTGATTGKVEVTTPEKTLKSNVVFRVTPQLTSFTPSSGPVGTPVTIEGVSLTQTTKVTFGGVAATSVTINTDTKVTAKVPTGAMTGKIAITTAGGTGVSSGIFTVTQ